MSDSNLLDFVWVAVASAMVMFMQAGFCMLESGMSRTKNSINVAIKNLIDLCVSGLLYWFVGFGLMFGTSTLGWIGSDGFMLDGYDDPKSLMFFVFQFVFCGTATTIISGAAAERMTFRGYVILSSLVGGLFYPVMGHWAWGGGLGNGPAGWLASMGFVDFAGSTVVHSVGGWIALATIIVIGPRLGRFPSSRRRRTEMNLAAIPGHDLGIATVGAMTLWFGWFGFNGGSTLGVDDRIPLILVNTNLAAAAGGVTAMLLTWAWEGRPVVSQLLVGVIAGLVAITAGCHMMTPLSAIIIGAVGSAVAVGAVYALEKMRIDDVVGAVPTHAVAGVWGTIAVALLGPQALLPAGDRLTQLGVQVLGVGVAMAWAFGGSIIVIWLLDKAIGLRVSARHEKLGLNHAEHGASTAMIDLAAEMHRHRLRRQFNRPVAVDRHTEAGQIGKAYNQVLNEVSREMHRRAEAESRYRDIVENSLEGIFQTTPDGQFQSANPSLLSIYGDASLNDLKRRVARVGENLYIDLNSRPEFVRSISQTGTVRDFRAQIRRADGEVIWISESVRAVKDDAGKLLYYEGTVVDITDRIDAERLHRERNFAEASNEAKSQFLARMSHEMRTPLGGVINTLELITDDMPAKQRKHMIEIAKQSAMTLLQLINNVLDLSRIEAGKLEMEWIETELEQTLQVATEMLYHLARKKGLRLASHVSPLLPPRVLVDGDKLRQVLVNLIGNAIKFTQSGEVTVSMMPVPATSPGGITLSGSQIILRIEVADTGMGIAEDRIEKIFEVYTQSDSSTTRRFGGSGLGLAICRQLIDLMGGRIGVKARDSGGTMFWIELPVEPVKVFNTHEASIVHGRTVCIIAPRHAETDSVMQMLEAWQMTAVHCQDRDALKRVVQDRNLKTFDYVLIDAEMQSIVNDIDSEGANVGAIGRETIWLGTPDDSATTCRSIERPIHASALLNELMLRSPHRPESTAYAAKRAESKNSEAAKAKSIIGNGETVLIVDDNEVNRLVAGEMVRRMGFEPITVDSGQAAIDELTRREIVIVLMDCEMPMMDGLEATTMIRRLHRENRLAISSHERLGIIACTAQATDSDRKRCLDASMDDYVTKPIRRDHLVTAITGILNAKPPIDLAELMVRCGDDQDVAREVLRAFTRRGLEDVQTMVQAVVAGSEETSAAAHRIKGAASTMAAHGLAQIAMEIERSARHDGPHLRQRYDDEVRRLEHEMDRCVAWIEQTLESLR